MSHQKIIIMLFRTVFLLLFALFFSCNTDTGNSLDIGEYLKLADSNSVYPSAGQVQMLKSFVPDQPFQPAPAIDNRAYWDKIAASESGKLILIMHFPSWIKNQQSLYRILYTGGQIWKVIAQFINQDTIAPCHGWNISFWQNVWKMRGNFYHKYPIT